MFRVLSTRAVIVLIALTIGSIPQFVSASQLSFQLLSNTEDDGQVAIIEVRLDPQDKVLNVVEGTIVFQGEIDDQLTVETETGGSVLSLWPVEPKYIPEDKAIRFTGGVPKGFNQSGLLFRMRLVSPTTGKVKVILANGTAYLNDGKGTKDPIFATSMTINLTGHDLSEVNTFSLDTQPPAFEGFEIGRDQSVHDGQYFISFNAIDDVSGVGRYEVKEGDLVTNVTNGVYVFKDQTRMTPVSITVYDKAGNSAVLQVPVKINWQNYGIMLLIVGAVILSFYVYKKNKK